MNFELPDLKRPQYPSSPEVLLSALAWSVVPRRKEKQAVGLIYERLPERARKKKKKIVVIEQTKPVNGKVITFCDALRVEGFADLEGNVGEPIGRAVANSMLGVRPMKGVGYASSAVGVAGALLQDSVGGLAVENPPNFAHLINTLFAMGGSDSSSTAAELWFRAATKHASQPRLSRIEAAYAKSVLSDYLPPTSPWPPAGPAAELISIPGAMPAWWKSDVLDAGIGTPFSWFSTSWLRLCSDEWVAQLAPRRWASWAVCILRQALGFAFLWEANFYRVVAKGIVDTSDAPAELARWAVSPVKPLVPIQRGSTSQMDVMPGIRRALSIGIACRKAIEAFVASNPSEQTSLGGFIEEARTRASTAVQRQLRMALTGSGEQGGLSNLGETVRYSLLARSNEEATDHYGLLRVASRNYTHVVPGAEWIVVMSAMAARGPSSTLRLGDVLQSLKSLGLQPRMDFLVSELERAGLCASAPDGDEGIEINLGFGRS